WSASGGSSRLFLYDPAPRWLCALSLHDALPISRVERLSDAGRWVVRVAAVAGRRVDDELVRRAAAFTDDGRPRAWLGLEGHAWLDRKSTRLNSSHVKISYAVFCLKKKTHTHSRG